MFHNKKWFEEQIKIYGTATKMSKNTGYDKDVLKEWCKKHNLNFANELRAKDLLTKEFLIQQYQLNKSVKMISKEFHILMDLIIDKNEEYGINVNDYNDVDILDNRHWLKEMYDKYNSISKLAEVINCPRTTLSRMCRVYGFHKPRYERKKENHVNEDYFKNIDTAEKAYFLGLIMADGNMHLKKDNNKYLFSLKLKSTDCDIIYKLAQAIEFDKEKIIFKKGKRKETITESVVIQIYNQAFCNNLINLGIIPKKGGTEHIPEQIPNEFMKDFIRGFIDGDGSVGIASNNRTYVSICSTSIDIMKEIKEYFKKMTGTDNKISYCNSIYTYTIAKAKDTYIMCSHLYYPECVSLKRKYQNAQKIINNYLK